MAFQHTYRDVKSSISQLATRYIPTITTSQIFAIISATASIADHHHDNSMVSLLVSGFMCLLATALPLHNPKISLEAIAIPLVTATPDYCYHTIALQAWVYIHTELNSDVWDRVMVLTSSTTWLYPLLARYTFPALKHLAIFLIYCRPLKFLTIVSIILAYRSLWKPAAAHGALPEGMNGIWSALMLHTVSVVTPAIEAQWFFYTLYLQFFCGPEPPGPWVMMSGAESVKMEGLLTGSAAWAFGYRPTTAHTMYLVVNVIIHPLRQRFTVARKAATPILMAQFWGLVWFLGSHAVLTLTKHSITTTSKKYLGSDSHNHTLWWYLLIDISVPAFKALVQIFKPWYQRLRQPNNPPPSPSPEPFQHTEITTPNTIRILCILPSLDNRKPIHCEMLLGTFTPTDPYKVYTGPKYTGISYCWDQPSTQKLTIHINSRPYQIQPTVHAILRTMREPVSPTHVWIDSICINQSDDAEKALQVQLMRLIYENADYVAGWLRGPSNPDPGSRYETSWRDLKDFWAPRRSNSFEYRAREMLGRINSTMYIQQDFDFASTLWNRNADTSSTTVAQSLPGSQEDWAALQTLITNPYFTRVWIIQEVVVARRVILHYGGQIIPWELFARAMTILASQGLTWKILLYFRHNEFKSLKPIELPGIYNGLVLENLRRWYRRPGFLTSPPVGSTKGMLSLEDTLKLCGRFEATWDVDRVFALLGVASDSDLLRVQVVYGGSGREVFVGLGRRLIAKHLVGGKWTGRGGVFSVLRFAGVGLRREDGTGGRKGVEGLPSWVPDWTQRMETALLSPANEEDSYRASGGSKCDRDNVKFVQGDRLMLKRVAGPRIRWVSDVFTAYPEKPGTLQFSSTFLAVVLHLGLRKGLNYHYTPAGSEPQSLVGAYWRTLEGDSTPSRSGRKRVGPVWGKAIMDCEIAALANPDQAQEEHDIGVLHYLKNRDDGALGEDDDDETNPLLCKMLSLQLKDNPDNIFSHMLMTDLSNANPSHRGGFTNILGSKKLQKSPFEYPLFALGRRFCLTTDGHMGLVPPGTVEGDRIVIFAGAPTPHVIRPVGGKVEGADGKTRVSNICELVGEAYIHGMMYGEGVKDGVDFKTVLLV